MNCGPIAIGTVLAYGLRASPVSSVAGYRVFRALNGVWGPAPVATTTSTTFKNTGLENGSMYFYTVAGKNLGGEGPRAVAVSAQPVAPPPTPLDVASVAGDPFVDTTVVNGPTYFPTTSLDQYAATLGRWFGVTDADLLQIFPNLANFAPQRLGFV